MSNYGSRAINRWWTSAYAQWGWGAAAGTKESLARKDAWLATINKYLVHSGRGGNALLSVRCQDIWLATTSLPLFRNTRNSCIRIANTNDTYILGYIGIWEWENRGGGGVRSVPIGRNSIFAEIINMIGRKQVVGLWHRDIIHGPEVHKFMCADRALQAGFGRGYVHEYHSNTVLVRSIFQSLVISDAW